MAHREPDILGILPDGDDLPGGRVEPPPATIHVWDLAGIARGLDRLGIGHGLSFPDPPRGEGEAPEAPRVEIEVDLGALAQPR